MKVDLVALLDEYWQNRAESAEADRDRYRDALARLVGALTAMDLSDRYTLEESHPHEDVRMTRPAWLWRELAVALDASADALQQTQRGREA